MLALWVFPQVSFKTFKTHGDQLKNFNCQTHLLFWFMQYVTLKEMPAVLVFKDETYFVYDGKFQHFNWCKTKQLMIKMLCLLHALDVAVRCTYCSQNPLAQWLLGFLTLQLHVFHSVVFHSEFPYNKFLFLFFKSNHLPSLEMSSMQFLYITLKYSEFILKGSDIWDTQRSGRNKPSSTVKPASPAFSLLLIMSGAWGWSSEGVVYFLMSFSFITFMYNLQKIWPGVEIVTQWSISGFMFTLLSHQSESINAFRFVSYYSFYRCDNLKTFCLASDRKSTSFKKSIKSSLPSNTLVGVSISCFFMQLWSFFRLTFLIRTELSWILYFLSEEVYDVRKGLKYCVWCYMWFCFT